MWKKQSVENDSLLSLFHSSTVRSPPANTIISEMKSSARNRWFVFWNHQHYTRDFQSYYERNCWSVLQLSLPFYILLMIPLPLVKNNGGNGVINRLINTFYIPVCGQNFGENFGEKISRGGGRVLLNGGWKVSKFLNTNYIIQISSIMTFLCMVKIFEKFW